MLRHILLYTILKGVFMPYKKQPKKPVENHKTAAWSNIENTSNLSGISYPSLEQVINAKEYVDENQK
jgi:hypothetical protein